MIAGFPTRHFRLTVGFTVSARRVGMQEQLKPGEEPNNWVATSLPLPSNSTVASRPAPGGTGGLGASKASAQFKEAGGDSTRSRGP